MCMQCCSDSNSSACGTCCEVGKANVLVQSGACAFQQVLHATHICPLAQHDAAICAPGGHICVAPVVVQGSAVCHHGHLHITHHTNLPDVAAGSGKSGF